MFRWGKWRWERRSLEENGFAGIYLVGSHSCRAYSTYHDDTDTDTDTDSGSALFINPDICIDACCYTVASMPTGSVKYVPDRTRLYLHTVQGQSVATSGTSTTMRLTVSSSNHPRMEQFFDAWIMRYWSKPSFKTCLKWHGSPEAKGIIDMIQYKNVLPCSLPG